MTEHVATKRETKIGFERIGAIFVVLVLLVVAVVVLSTLMSAARTAADHNVPAADGRTSAIQAAKQNPSP